MSVNYFDDMSSIESSSCRERRYSVEDERISEQETVIKSLTYAVQVSDMPVMLGRAIFYYRVDGDYAEVRRRDGDGGDVVERHRAVTYFIFSDNIHSHCIAVTITLVFSALPTHLKPRKKNFK